MKYVFDDKDDNELDCFINTKGKLYLSVGTKGADPGYHSGFITLDKSDVQQLIKVLLELENEMEE